MLLVVDDQLRVCGSVRSARTAVRAWSANRTAGESDRNVAAMLLTPDLMVPVVVPDLSVLDESVMTAIRSLGASDEPDVYAEVAGLFLIDVPVHLLALAAAIAAADSESVWRIAHRLRGSTLEMGVVRMARLCGEIEHAARAGSLADATDQAEHLDREFATARAAMYQVIASTVLA